MPRLWQGLEERSQPGSSAMVGPRNGETSVFNSLYYNGNVCLVHRSVKLWRPKTWETKKNTHLAFKTERGNKQRTRRKCHHLVGKMEPAARATGGHKTAGMVAWVGKCGTQQASPVGTLSRPVGTCGNTSLPLQREVKSSGWQIWLERSLYFRLGDGIDVFHFPRLHFWVIRMKFIKHRNLQIQIIFSNSLS